MTEAEWLAAEDSWPMLRFLENQGLSQRKIHLFVCACCRCCHWDALRSMNLEETVAVAEQFADGLATESKLHTARERLAWGRAGVDELLQQALCQALWAAKVAVGVFAVPWGQKLPSARALWAAKYIRGPRLWGQLSQDAKCSVRVQCDLLRDIFAPFATPSILPLWLAWNGGVVVRLAQAAYDERVVSEGGLDRARLAVLADALEEAGCTDADLLGHLRGPGLHVRGCFAVDALLGKG